VEVRDAQLGDIRAVQRVARTTWDHTYLDTIPEEVRAEFVRRAYSDNALMQRIANDVFLVAMGDDEGFSFADFGIISESEAGLAAIYVLPEAQGQGLGSKLLEPGN
jgi:GNAT superfamily N-acetyltransferase